MLPTDDSCTCKTIFRGLALPRVVQNSNLKISQNTRAACKISSASAVIIKELRFLRCRHIIPLLYELDLFLKINLLLCTELYVLIGC